MTQPFIRIIIVSAGLAGLSAAVPLANDGHEVHVLERSSGISSASGTIFIRSNAVRSFCRWGMRHLFEAIATPIRSPEMRHGLTDEVLDRTEPASFSEFPEWAIDREALQILLCEHALAAGASVSFDRDVVHIDEGDKEARVTCRDGTTLAADLLLVADGISSRLRTSVLAPYYDAASLVPIPVPSIHYPTEIPRERLLTNDLTKTIVESRDAGNAVLWTGNGGYAIGKYNASLGKYYLAFSIQHSVENEDTNPRLYDEVGDPSVFQNFFASYTPMLVALARMADSCSRWRLARLEPLERWSSPGRRLVLLGDSAHAMLPNLGQGFSCAVEDADALSVLLESVKSGVDVPRYVELWEKIRIPRATKLQIGSLWNYNLYNAGKAPASELTEQQRNLPMGRGDSDAPINTPPWLKWVHDYDAAAEARHTLG